MTILRQAVACFAYSLSVFVISILPESRAAYAQADKTEKAATQSGGKNNSPGWLFEGFARLGYKLRYTREYSDSTEEDQDIRGILSLSLRDREKKPKHSINLLGSFNIDTDGSPGGGTGPFRDANSSYRSSANAMLYSAYVESSFSKTRLFIGRQSVYRGESLDFDGIRAEHRAGKNLNLSLYGGIPSNFWESSPESDHFGGGGVEVGIPKKYSLRTDYIHIRDKKTYEPGKPAAKDNLIIISGKYRRFKPLDIYCLYSTVNGNERRALFRAKWIDKKNRLLINASVIRQHVMLADYSTEISPFVFVLAEYSPYYRYKLMMLKGLGSRFEIEAGADLRSLIESDDEGMLNHSYERYYAGVHFKKLLKKKLDLTLMAEKWNTLSGNHITAIEGLAKLYAGRKLIFRIGSDFSKYIYDYNFDEERENVYSAFARADYKVSRTSTIRFKYSFNRDDREDYNLFELSLILKW